MKPMIVKRPRVERDLIEHFAFIALDKLEPAERFLDDAKESFERLSAMPGMGTLWKSRRRHLAGIRFYPMPGPFRSYLIFYRPIDGGIEVLAVVHGARDLKHSMGEILE